MLTNIACRLRPARGRDSRACRARQEQSGACQADQSRVRGFQRPPSWKGACSPPPAEPASPISSYQLLWDIRVKAVQGVACHILSNWVQMGLPMSRSSQSRSFKCRPAMVVRMHTSHPLSAAAPLELQTALVAGRRAELIQQVCPHQRLLGPPSVDISIFRACGIMIVGSSASRVDIHGSGWQ